MTEHSLNYSQQELEEAEQGMNVVLSYLDAADHILGDPLSTKEEIVETTKPLVEVFRALINAGQTTLQGTAEISKLVGGTIPE